MAAVGGGVENNLEISCVGTHFHGRSGDFLEKNYRADVEKILFSKGYLRYADKTQVIYLIRNDHVARRGLHVQLVSHLARSVAPSLGLDLSLVEAIALGHDVGHPPFGHEGEGYLNDLAKECAGISFAHPCHSCRLSPR